ncbi:MAG TPA: VTT domain-containing protein, partial [Candidatus Paceibacterota bacterium]|nr:VTT domain-containing protein [Candidatus Paceibacterota bacterium]
PERLNGHPWKGCISETVSRVRIPFSPPMIEQITSYIQPIIQDYGALGVFLATLLEEIVAPIPSPLVPLTAGFFLLPSNEIFINILLKAIFLIALPVAVGVSIGSLVVYAIAYFGGKPLIEKTKKWIGLSWDDVQKAETKLTKGKGDEITLFILRILPVIPGVAISGFCGMVRYSIKSFVIITFFGSFVRATLLGFLGFYVGVMYFEYVGIISKIEKYLFAILLVIGIFFILRFLYFKRKIVRN